MKTKAATGFAGRVEFDIACNHATGPEIVVLDGVTVRGGVLPEIRFVTRGDGRIVLEEKERVAA